VGQIWFEDEGLWRAEVVEDVGYETARDKGTLKEELLPWDGLPLCQRFKVTPTTPSPFLSPRTHEMHQGALHNVTQEEIYIRLITSLQHSGIQCDIMRCYMMKCMKLCF
jgi:hypothetical protein